MGISSDDLAYFVDRAIDGMIEIVRDLGDELACTRPDLPGANSPYAILFHCLGVMGYWGGHTVAGRDMDRDRDAEFRANGLRRHPRPGLRGREAPVRRGHRRRGPCSAAAAAAGGHHLARPGTREPGSGAAAHPGGSRPASRPGRADPRPAAIWPPAAVRQLAAERDRRIAAQVDRQMPQVVEGDQHRRLVGLELDDGQRAAELVKPDPAPRWRVQGMPDEPADDEVVRDQQLAAVAVAGSAQLLDGRGQLLAALVAYVLGNLVQERAKLRRDLAGLAGGRYRSTVTQQLGAAHGYAGQVLGDDLRGLGGPAQGAM